MKRVLITGGGGFIGSHLVDSQLDQGNYVRVVDQHLERLNHISDHKNIDIVSGDITGRELVELLVDGMEEVYHLASAHLDVNLSEQQYRRVNVEATIKLLEAANLSGVKRFIHCSSVGVMGDIKNPPANETYPCNPTNIYEKTKLEGEQAALGFNKATGFPVVVVRPAWVYGPRCPRTEKLIRAIRTKRFVMFGDGQNLRHPVFITDAVRGIELCAEIDQIAGQVYIIAGEKPVTSQKLIETIASVINVHPPSIHLPVEIGMLMGRFLENSFNLIEYQPPFSTRSLDFFVKNNSYEIAKAQKELGFDPQIELRSGLVRTMNR